MVTSFTIIDQLIQVAAKKKRKEKKKWWGQRLFKESKSIQCSQYSTGKVQLYIQVQYTGGYFQNIF